MFIILGRGPRDITSLRRNYLDINVITFELLEVAKAKITFTHSDILIDYDPTLKLGFYNRHEK